LFIYDLRNKFENGFVPFRKPKALGEAGSGIGGWWKSLVGGE
jgi:hypothetical protein